MRFSVLIPVYNIEKYLCQCLDSVVAQTFTDFEAILVDDGSTDSSGKICDEYAATDSRFRVKHKKNEGLISARRVGIAEARGEWCVFIDSDDFAEPKLLETVDSSVDGADMVIYSFRYYEDGRTRERKAELFPDGTVFDESSKTELYERFIRSHDVTAIWIKAIRTEILKSDPTDYKPFFRYNMSEDVLQSLYPLTAAKMVVYRNVPLVNYRINPSSVSRSFTPETIRSKSSLHVYRALMDYLPLWGLDSAEMRSALNTRWFSLAVYTFMQYYEAATPAQRREIVDFDWDSLIPEEARAVTAEEAGEVYFKLYSWIKAKDYLRIRMYFAKKNAYGKIKQLTK